MDRPGLHRYPHNAAAVKTQGPALDLLARIVRAEPIMTAALLSAYTEEAREMLRRAGVAI